MQTIRWVGQFPYQLETAVGLESDRPLPGRTNDGEYKGKRYFTSPPGTAVFLPVYRLSPLRRESDPLVKKQAAVKEEQHHRKESRVTEERKNNIIFSSRQVQTDTEKPSNTAIKSLSHSAHAIPQRSRRNDYKPWTTGPVEPPPEPAGFVYRDGNQLYYSSLGKVEEPYEHLMEEAKRRIDKLSSYDIDKLEERSCAIVEKCNKLLDKVAILPESNEWGNHEDSTTLKSSKPNHTICDTQTLSADIPAHPRSIHTPTSNSEKGVAVSSTQGNTLFSHAPVSNHDECNRNGSRSRAASSQDHDKSEQLGGNEFQNKMTYQDDGSNDSSFEETDAYLGNSNHDNLDWETQAKICQLELLANRRLRSLNKVIEERDALQKQLSEKKSEVDRYKRKFRKDISFLKKELHDVKQKLENLQGERDELRRRNRSLSASLKFILNDSEFNQSSSRALPNQVSSSSHSPKTDHKSQSASQSSNRALPNQMSPSSHSPRTDHKSQSANRSAERTPKHKAFKKLNDHLAKEVEASLRRRPGRHEDEDSVEYLNADLVLRDLDDSS